jgi:hypothetical protein
VVIHHVEAVELQHELAGGEDLLVLVAAVPALAAEDGDVEVARAPDVTDDEERLGPDARCHPDRMTRGGRKEKLESAVREVDVSADA